MITSRSVFLRRRNVSDKFVEKIKTNILCSKTLFFFIVPFMRQYGKISYSRTDHSWQHDACAFHVGWLKLQTYIHNT